MLYYHVADDCLETETELTEEEINRKIRENLRANGVINKDEAVIDRLIDEKAESPMSFRWNLRKTERCLPARM